MRDVWEQDKSSDIEQQPSFGDCTLSKTLHQMRGLEQNQREHHIILTKYEAVHPTAVSENNSSPGMLIILTKPEQFVFQVTSLLAN